MEPPFVLVVEVFFFWQMISVIFICKNIPRRQTSSSRLCSIIRTRNSWSRKNRSWIPSQSFFLHFFFNWLARYYSLSPGFFPYVWPWGLPFLMAYSGSERRSLVFLTKPRLASVSFCKKCPHVQWTMPTFQYDRHALHCVLGSVSSNSNNSVLPTSWIIFFDSGLNGWQAWFCRRSCWRACRSGWFSIFLNNSRTLVLCACFTTECGNPGIRKSMFTSFSIVCSWLESSWFITGLTVISRSALSPTLAAGRGSKRRYQYCSDISGTILYLRALQGHSGRNLIDPLLQDNVIIQRGFFRYIYIYLPCWMCV